MNFDCKPYMSKAASDVAEFHSAFNLSKDLEWSTETLELRQKLLEEEFQEYESASEGYMHAKENYPADADYRRKMRMELLDAMADMVYVIYGTADVLGLRLDEAFRRVHESNMSKLGEDGRPIVNGQNGIFDDTRPVGKVLKGPNFKKPDLSDLV